MEAVNARDWERACEGVLLTRAACLKWLPEEFPDGGVRVDRIVHEDGRSTLALSTPLLRGEVESAHRGWTAYVAPVYPIERHEGRYVLHPEVAIIR